jgi:hypothetical protein
MAKLKKTPTKRPRKDNLMPPWEKGKSGNPDGRPNGSKNFSTLFAIAIKKVAEKSEISLEDAEVELIITAYAEAKKGNYNYYKDIMDRKYGQPTKPIDITTGGESFKSTPEEREAINKVFKNE